MDNHYKNEAASTGGDIHSAQQGHLHAYPHSYGAAYSGYTAYPAYYPPYPTWPPANVRQNKVKREKAENAFKPDVADFIFALAAFALGYLFSRWVFFSWQGWGISVFTTAYLLIVTAYLIKKGAFVKGLDTYFWMACTMVIGVSYAIWENAGFSGERALFLFFSAVYYALVASGRRLLGKTGNFLISDGFNMILIIPLRNIFNQYVSFSALGKGKQRGKILPVTLGVILAFVLLLILIPMLEQADSGGFGKILEFFRDFITFDFGEFIWYAAFAIPIAAYLYGLISGVAHKKGTDIIKLESAQKNVSKMRIIHPVTLYISLGAICVLYLVFILSQAPYFFSAFNGRRPEGWLIYSEYARRGFFELCGIAAINLVILIIGNVTCKKHRMELRILRILNIAIAVITLVLIATAYSKMALYIGAYGLTMRRLMPCVFMVFMAMVFVALIVLQRRSFSIVRFSLVTGAVMLCALCLSNPDAMVVRYNTDRYLSGSLPDYDTDVLYRAGSAGVLPALEVYRTTEDTGLRSQLTIYLNYHNGFPEAHTLSYEGWRAREAIISESVPYVTTKSNSSPEQNFTPER